MQIRLFQKLLLLLVFWSGISVLCFSVTHAKPSLESRLKPVLEARVQQKNPKMKLKKSDVDQFYNFLNHLPEPIPNLELLQTVMPKTTVELLMAANKRGLALKEAEKIAEYLKEVVESFHFSNVSAFDENTSHIIGREWHEIDYSGENLNWQSQKRKYLPYGIIHFKSVKCLRSFIQVESKLPYFKKIYRPQLN